jgi:hypothetical protein
MIALSSILALTLAAAAPRERLPPIDDAPVTPAGSQVSPLAEDPANPWRLGLSTGVAGKFGGRRISANEANRSVLLFFGGQADASWPEGHGQAARLRFRLFTGGESGIYVPSDGDGELAWMMGRREFRFVLARVEVARQPGVALQALAQAGTLPSFEGTLPLAGDAMQLAYFVSPVEAAWVRYYGGAHVVHLPGWNAEDDHPSAASAARLRYSVLLPPAIAVSVQGDFLKFWGPSDLLLALEGTIGYQLPRQQAAFHLGARWSSYTRRAALKDSHETNAEVMVIGSATLAY